MPFSVLMSLYAKERPIYLRQSLDSIFNQTLHPDEVILVEDGPLTEALNNLLDEYEARYPELRRVKLSINGGLGNALNEGIRYCSHELIARMDTDDICFPDRFEKQIRYMSDNRDIDVSSSWVEEFESTVDNVKSIKRVPATQQELISYIRIRNPLNHPAVIFRKQAVEKAGGYIHFPLFEDYYLWARMFANGAKFGNIQEPLLHFRISSDMFKRRGGLKYTINSAKFQWKLHKLGIISYAAAVKASIIRGAVYLMPNSIRKAIYSKLLRS